MYIVLKELVGDRIDEDELDGESLLIHAEGDAPEGNINPV